MTAVNQEVLKDPSTINVDGYGRGWLFEMTGDLAETLSAEGYLMPAKKNQKPPDLRFFKPQQQSQN